MSYCDRITYVFVKILRSSTIVRKSTLPHRPAKASYHASYQFLTIFHPRYMSNDLLSHYHRSLYKYTSNMLLRSINIKPSPRLFASIAPNTQPVAANTSNQSSPTSTKKGSRLRKPALSLDQVHITPVMQSRKEL